MSVNAYLLRSYKHYLLTHQLFHNEFQKEGDSSTSFLLNKTCYVHLRFLHLQWVLHDWGDDDCIRILKKCREAIPIDKGKVIIVEAIIDEKDGVKYTKLPQLLVSRHFHT